MAKAKSKAPDQTSVEAKLVGTFNQMTPERRAFFPGLLESLEQEDFSNTLTIIMDGVEEEEGDEGRERIRQACIRQIETSFLERAIERAGDESHNDERVRECQAEIWEEEFPRRAS